MKLFHDNYQNITNNEPLTLAIGNFDGVHIGHQNIMKMTKKYKDTKSAAMTFSPHPVSVITKTVIPTLMDDHDKANFLEKMGMDYFFIINFTPDFSKLSVDDFINFLKKINVKRLVIGRDFKFAYRGQGNVTDLEKHFEVDLVEDLLYKNTRVSTTYIKQLLDQANISLASKLLNRTYNIHGEVVHGDKVGRLIGFPTANIDYKNYYLPKVGIYAVKVLIDGKMFLGCANLGHNPTLNYSSSKRLEVFIIDYDGDLYQKEITIYFEHYLRDEVKFDNLDALIDQIKKDVEETIQLSKNSLSYGKIKILGGNLI
ncbi:bifunctional riboflavin kinase/FAD synthetase [Acholeplasma hippikon]|nr:bifunctional riboflavin kinase/FAD synthetase [Acholeplasma hippikon]